VWGSSAVWGSNSNTQAESTTVLIHGEN